MNKKIFNLLSSVDNGINLILNEIVKLKILKRFTPTNVCLGAETHVLTNECFNRRLWVRENNYTN